MEKFNKYGRKMKLTSNKVWKEVPWIDNDPNRPLFSNNCHWGQLKLFYSELEFITICIENGYRLTDSVIIYIGAAPGTHIIYLRKLFPDLHWILIDPHPFHIKKDDFIEIYTGDCGFFKDEMIPELLNHKFITTYKNLFFISDIRTKAEENVIFHEMIDQQRWVIKLNVDMSMLKFRLPYTTSEQSNWSYNIPELKISAKNINSSMMYYLKGDLYMQIYPPQYSTESRLIIDKKIHKFKLFNYDTKKYESKCYYFNTVIRQLSMTYKNSYKLKDHILGCKDNYETASQYQIIDRYFIATKQVGNISQMIYNIYKFHNTIPTKIKSIQFNKSLAFCNMFTIYKDKLSSVELLKSMILKKNTTNEKIKELINDIYTKSNDFNVYQLQAFAKGNVLSKQDYADQIQLLNDGIKANNLIYEILIGYLAIVKI